MLPPDEEVIARRVYRISPRAIYLGLLTIGITMLATGWLTLGSVAAEPDTRWVEGVVGDPAMQVNPLLAAPGSADADLVALVFNGLMRIDGDGTPLPDLVEHENVISPSLIVIGEVTARDDALAALAQEAAI